MQIDKERILRNTLQSQAETLNELRAMLETFGTDPAAVSYDLAIESVHLAVQFAGQVASGEDLRYQLEQEARKISRPAA